MLQSTPYKSKQLSIKTGFHLRTPSYHTLSIRDGAVAGLQRVSAAIHWREWTSFPSCDHVSHEA